MWPPVGIFAVECLTRDRGAAGSSLTVLYPWARTLILESTGSTQEYLSLYNWKIFDWGLQNQIKLEQKSMVHYRKYPLFDL